MYVFFYFGERGIAVNGNVFCKAVMVSVSWGAVLLGVMPAILVNASLYGIVHKNSNYYASGLARFVGCSNPCY